jgi:hypothetical protein
VKGDRDGDLSASDLAAYLEGEVTPSQSAAIESRLAERPAARRRLARLREVRGALEAPIPALERIDLVPKIDRAIRTAGEPRRRRAPFWLGFLTASALAGVAALVLWPRPEEFRAKSAAPGERDRPERWAGFRAYHVGAAGAPEPLGERFSAGDRLVFSYTNLGPRPFEYLMIFAVDAGGEVRWFYPPYERRGTNPAAVAIRGGEADVALGEAVRHDFARGPLSLIALFTHRPVTVLEVEAVIGGVHGTPSRLPFADAAEQRLVTQADP